MNTDPEILNGHKCPYCGGRTSHTSNAKIYGEEKGYIGMIYYCRPCKAYVGTHKNNPTQSLGRLANHSLREYKITAHYYFDQLWRKKMSKDNVSKTQARKAAYKWLSEQLKIDIQYCHIGYFGEYECNLVVHFCKPIVEKLKK